MRFRLLPFAVASFLIGCVAEEPHTMQPGGDNPNGPSPNVTTDFKPPPPVDMAKPDDGKADKPILDAIPSTTVYDSIPVHGTAEVGASVLIKAADGSTVAADVLSSGRFCADVPLKKEMMNHFELRTIDTNGNESDAITLDVQQHGSPTQQQGSQTESQNMSIGGVTASSLSWNSGNKDNIHDGDLNTYAGSWQRSWAFTDYITVQLSGRRAVDHIRIRAPGSCPLTAPFQLYVSNADAPSDPGTTPMSWYLASDVPTGKVGTDHTFVFSSPTTMTHVSLYFDRGVVAWGDEINCGNEWTWGAYYSITDVEAWSAPNQIAPPPVSAPTCTSGGD